MFDAVHAGVLVLYQLAGADGVRGARLCSLLPHDALATSRTQHIFRQALFSLSRPQLALLGEDFVPRTRIDAGHQTVLHLRY